MTTELGRDGVCYLNGEALTWPEAPCCAPGFPGGCACPPSERALRGWQSGAEMPPMTPEQREFCLGEIGQIEGWRRSEHENNSDGDLARATLGAWLDYCRDKGLL